MNTLANEVVQAIKVAFHEKATPAQVKVLQVLPGYINKLSKKEKEKLFIFLEKNQKALSPSSASLLWSYLFSLEKEKRYLYKLAYELQKNETDLRVFHFLLWQLVFILFQLQGEIPADVVLDLREKILRTSYQNVLGLLPSLRDVKALSTNASVKKIGVIVNQILSINHAPTRNALILASGLMRQGVEVKIINCNTFPVKPDVAYYNSIIANVHPGLIGDQKFKYEDAEFGSHVVSIYSHKPFDFTSENLGILQDKINAEQFDALINVGDNLFVTECFSGVIPILTVTTNRQIPIATSDYFCLLHDKLTPQEESTLGKLELHGYQLGWSFNATQEEPTEPLKRSDFNIPEDSIVSVVVGNRLKRELSDSFITICKDALQNPKFYLVLVGDADEIRESLELFGVVEHPQIILAGYQPNLRSVYRICDIYLNPFRSGGGNSAQMAVIEKLPIVTLDHCDTAVCVSSEMRSQDIESYRVKLLKLINDSAYYEEERHKTDLCAQHIKNNQPVIEHMYQAITAIKQSIQKS